MCPMAHLSPAVQNRGRLKLLSDGLQVIRHTRNRGANPLSALAYTNCTGIRGNSIEHLFLSDKLLFGHTRIPACAGMTANGKLRIGDTSESATTTYSSRRTRQRPSETVFRRPPCYFACRKRVAASRSPAIISGRPCSDFSIALSIRARSSALGLFNT